MKDDDIIQVFWDMFMSEVENRNDDDYEVDHEQMRKLVNAYQFFTSIANRDGGYVDPFEITPKMEHSGITAYFTVFYLSGEDLQRFYEIVGDMSAISVDSTTDNQICISFTIPRVFKKKQ